MSSVELVDEETGEVHHPDVLISVDDARTLTAKIASYGGVLGVLLDEAKEKGAWKVLGYKSWGAYVAGEFDITRNYANRLIHQAVALREIGDAAGVETVPMGTVLPERVVRELDIDATIEAVRHAVEAIPKGATMATRLELVDRIVKELRAQAKAEDAAGKIPPPEPEVPAPPAPVADPHSPTDVSSSPSAGDEPQQPPSAAAPNPHGDGSEPRTDTPAADTGTGQPAPHTGDEVDGGVVSSSAATPPSLELEAAAEREAIARDMVAARALLNRDPARVVELMTAEDAATWIDHKEDMAEWFHGFDAAMTERNQLRSV